MPNPTSSPVFERISSPLAASPFDKGIASRDREVLGYIKKINKFPGTAAVVDEVIALYAGVFPGQGLRTGRRTARVVVHSYSSALHRGR